MPCASLNTKSRITDFFQRKSVPLFLSLSLSLSFSFIDYVSCFAFVVLFFLGLWLPARVPEAAVINLTKVMGKEYANLGKARLETRQASKP